MPRWLARLSWPRTSLPLNQGLVRRWPLNQGLARRWPPHLLVLHPRRLGWWGVSRPFRLGCLRHPGSLSWGGLALLGLRVVSAVLLFRLMGGRRILAVRPPPAVPFRRLFRGVRLHICTSARPSRFTRILGDYVGGPPPFWLFLPLVLLRFGGLTPMRTCPCRPAVARSRLRSLLGGLVPFLRSAVLRVTAIMGAARRLLPRAVVGGSLRLPPRRVVPFALLPLRTRVQLTPRRSTTFPSRLLGPPFVGGLRPCGLRLLPFLLCPSRFLRSVFPSPQSRRQRITFRRATFSSSGFAPLVSRRLGRTTSS